jgi:ATP-binding cassette subfamily B protein
LDPLIAILITSIILIFYFIFFAFFKTRIQSLGFESAKQQVNIYKVVEEGLGGIRDVLIDKLQSSFISDFKNIGLIVRSSEAKIQMLSASPRYIVEPISMLLIITLSCALFLLSDDGVSSVIPIIGLIAIVAQRLLPAIQSIYSSWTLICGGRAALKGVIEILSAPIQGARQKTMDTLLYEKSLILNNIKYEYPNSHIAIKGITLEIKKGEHIGIIGKSGGGKSTLLDIVMGLLVPSSGILTVDGVKIEDLNLGQWQAKVAHVPQSVYIANTTIIENIAFGVPVDQIDFSRVRRAAKNACLSNVIEDLPMGYESLAGDRGGLLSGGQRQRIGIARAFYKNADLIIFDEATNALDEELESDLLEKILKANKNITVIMVSHNLNSLRYCDRYIEISNGLIKRSGSISEIHESIK